MRILVGLLLLLVSFTAHAKSMGFDEARHLLNRASLGATYAEVQSYAQLSREQAVDKLLKETRTTTHLPAPAEVQEFERPERFRNMSEEERKKLLRKKFHDSVLLRAWWYQEMLTTSSPLTERMTLFWHNHFATSQQKVKSPTLMYRQNVLLRQHATGNFGELLHAIAKDPAMLIYLDSASNRKGQPNENFAREVMELFTLGEGNYTEKDIKEAARTFTGWSLDRKTGQFRFYRPFHDEGIKTVLGKSGNYDGDAILDILLNQPRTAEFITTKLWLEFISPAPDSKQVAYFANAFRQSRYDIKTLLRTMLTSEAFYAPENRAVLTKSPVDLLIGTLRTFDIRTDEMRPVVLVSRQLGQDVFAPPSVKGWPVGEAWINSTTLLARKQVLERLFRAQEMSNGERLEVQRSDDVLSNERRSMKKAERALSSFKFDVNQWYASLPGSEAQKQGYMNKLLLAMAPTQPLGNEDMPIDRVRGLVLDPAYQLK